MIAILAQGLRAPSPTPQTASKHTTASTNLATPQTAQIKRTLKQYLKQTAREQNVSVTFYNLAPVAGSAAAKNTLDDLNRPGTVAVSVHGKQQRVAANTDKLYVAGYLCHL